MAGWSILPNGSGLDSSENVVSDENKIVVIVSSDDDDDDDDRDYNKNDESDCSSDVRLRDLFDEVLSHFIKAIGEKGLFRPLPVILDGEEKKPLDLFTLFSVVRGKGGYGSVSNRQLWGFVARELGLRVRESASAKLLYFKYLSELEKWVFDGESFGGLNGVFRLLSSEIETEFRGLLPEIELAQIEEIDDNDNSNNKSELVVGSDLNLDDDEKGKDYKRKRECMLDMLRWLAEVAKLSSGRSIGECSDGKEFFAQAIRAREVLLRSRHANINNHEEALGQKKPKMHPSMYDDSMARSHHSSERLRCSKRLTNVAKSRLCPCCNAGPPNHLSKSAEPIDEPPPPPSPPEPIEAELPPPAAEPVPPLEKHVSVGPEFQAEVPEWTGPIRDSDPKWLGTRVWPPPESSSTKADSTSLSVVGKGRLGFCRCPFPGSGECVRFHVAEARMKLKLELGTAAFFAWGFHQMGEEVSLRWAPEEERQFKEVVRSNNKAFGDRKVWWLLKKTRESLVSYYFNVFLVQKRSYQNRVTPKEVDSDDDEAEFGSIGGLYGNGSVGLLGPGVEACAQNMQCAELEEARI